MSLLGEAWDLLRKYGDSIGIDWDDAPGPLDRLPNTDVMSSVANLAGSPILSAAQLTIYGMKASTGSGEPQAGEAFETSAAKYAEAGALLVKTEVYDADQWDGTAATAYQAKASAHRHQTFEVADAEKAMGQLLHELGIQVKETRQTLQDRVDFLADYDTATSWMNAIPGGAAVKAAADAGVAATQLAWAETSMAQLISESAVKARAILDVVGKYEAAAGQQLFGEETGPDGTRVELPCGEPFGDERRNGSLPTRTLEGVPYIPPYHTEPPVLQPK
ncbi:EspA/EspE family type VII secretion system effector [Mycolicibacterium sp.]|uniref:EspA/EspE family type VII secretion system effector n=1 Tax=Mycolicibacterium sp. TaxID=2320850 RepID=UPI001A2812F0|nr:EspA/EspE family type VII secretion system effector [Mycolicibacterium sp.]MBJ7341932.1 hypothetical protein [Mycolicibacterium sp.]